MDVNALVVDDSKIMRKLVMRALQGSGLAQFTFTEAGDGVEALEKFDGSAVDIIFVDRNMPRMNGIDFAAKVRTITENHLPIVMITSEETLGEADEAQNQAAIDKFITKPFTEESLKEQLGPLFEGLTESAKTSEGSSLDALVKLATDRVGESTKEMFSTVCGVKLEFQEDDGQAAEEGGIIGIISVLGDVDWCIFLGLPRQTAPVLASKFAGFEISFDSEDMGDAIGELANILAGEVKRRLDAEGLKVKLSTPSIVRAADLKLLIQRNVNTVKMCFTSPVGPLWTQVSEPAEKALSGLRQASSLPAAERQGV